MDETNIVIHLVFVVFFGVHCKISIDDAPWFGDHKMLHIFECNFFFLLLMYIEVNCIKILTESNASEIFQRINSKHNLAL